MASLYKRTGSPFWWLKWRNPANGKVGQFSTECRIGIGRDYTKAIAMRNEYAVKESKGASAVRSHPFHEWVVDYLEATHSNSPRTLQRYKSSWELVATYLASKDITSPIQLTRADCLAYVGWRKKVPHLNKRGEGGKKISMNTILLELKVLGKVMHEAVVREIIESNPCSRLKLKKDPARVKDEMTDAQIQIVRGEIQKLLAKAETQEQKNAADFLSVSFEIARLQGIRLSETYLPMENVDVERQMLLVRGKGNKLEEVNMNPALVPLFQRLQREGRTHTYVQPKLPSLRWFKLFRAIRAKHPGFKNISYHSTRVTVITRMERAGVPENVMMKTVLHSSTTVHRGYRRVRPGELTPYWPSVDVKNPGGAVSPSQNRPAGERSDSPPPSPTTTAPSSGDRG